LRRVLFGLAAVTLSVAGAIAIAPTAAVAATMPLYVSMGDSLSSGEGTYGTYDSGTDTSTNMCHRSSMPYSVQYDLMSISNYAMTNVACSGAGVNEINNIRRPNNTGGIPDANENPQLDAIGGSTRLITISIGINDLNLVGFATACYKLADTTEVDNCFKNLRSTQPYHDNLTGLPGKLAGVYDAIHKKAANATVAVLTYPNVFPATYTGMCEGLVVLNKGFALVTSQGMLDATHAAIDDLDNAIAGAVGSRPGFILVDIRNALAGHDVCASDRWVNQVNGNPLDPDHESLHPNTAGYQAIARVLAKRLDAGYFADGTVDQSIVNAYNTYGGPDAFGYPANNGGGIYVHYWSGGAEANVQDFTGGNFGPTIIVQGSSASYYVRGGFRDAYIGGGWSRTCHAPLTNEYAFGGGTRQDFVYCYMTWTSSTGVVVHGTNPNTCTDYGGTTTTGPNACIGFFTTSVWFSGGGIGLRGQEIWTYANGTVRDSTANYTLHSLDPTHAYTLQAYIPNGHSNASHAHYHYCGTNGGCADGYVNQNNFTNAWASFGTVCTSDGNATIVLADDGGDQ
jgi:lysophospholipase L1-like esterase